MQQQHFAKIHYRIPSVEYIHGHISVQYILVECQMISIPSCAVNQFRKKHKNLGKHGLQKVKLIPTSTGCYILKTSSSFCDCTLRNLMALIVFLFVCLLSSNTNNCNTSHQDPGKGWTLL